VLQLADQFLVLAVEHENRRRVVLDKLLEAGQELVENLIEPDAPVEGNAYDRKFPKRLALPATLWDAAQRLKSSKPARALFGDAFVDHFAATREWEEREFRKHITDWEMERYFEII
jgi:glutamine synthetase